MQRRSFLRGLGLVAAASAVITPSMVMAAEAPTGPNALTIEAALQAITGGKAVVVSPLVHLKAPEIAENGAVVPVTIEVDSPMTEDNYVKAIHVFATKNSNVRCADVMLTPANGAAMLATRVKLGTSQAVMALIETSKGEFLSASQNVKVTIGGCG
ncbi:MAG: thiosulfate oxidation carrier protein SoxY [Helicobacteraceae bacterium]|jgi:sulfur-oxidizing protein SoxY|nr:thiosulfate oxidation carrier protein SoxY [Helicobacteraceae bacterium]